MLVTGPHGIGLLVGRCQRLKVLRVTRLRHAQFGVVSCVHENTITPGIERLLPILYILDSALWHAVEHVRQLAPQRLGEAIVATMVRQHAGIVLKELDVQFFLVLGHAFATF